MEHGDVKLFRAALADAYTQQNLKCYAEILVILLRSETVRYSAFWPKEGLVRTFKLLLGAFAASSGTTLADNDIRPGMLEMDDGNLDVVLKQAVAALLNILDFEDQSVVASYPHFRRFIEAAQDNQVLKALMSKDGSFVVQLALKASSSSEASQSFFYSLYEFIIPSNQRGTISQLYSLSAAATDNVVRYGHIVLPVGMLHLMSADPKVRSAALEIVMYCANTFSLIYSQGAGDGNILEIQAGMMFSELRGMSKKYCEKLLEALARGCSFLAAEVVVEGLNMAVTLHKSRDSMCYWCLEMLGPWMAQVDFRDPGPLTLVAGGHVARKDQSSKAEQVRLSLIHIYETTRPLSI